MKKVLLTLVMVLVVAGAVAYAQNTASVAVTVKVDTIAKLSLDQTTLTFESADPDVTASLIPTEAPINITAKIRAGSTNGWSLTLAASAANMTDTLGSAATIPVNNLTWTATGGAFLNGTVSNAAQEVAHEHVSGQYAGVQTFRMVNSWAYSTGEYTVTLNYTLAAV